MKLSHLVILLIISIILSHNISKGFFVVWVATFIAYELGLLKIIKNPATTGGIVIKTRKNTLDSKNIIGTVEYFVDNKAYYFETSSPVMPKGKKICVKYSKDDPGNSTICPTIVRWLLPILFFIWGIYQLYIDLIIH